MRIVVLTTKERDSDENVERRREGGSERERVAEREKRRSAMVENGRRAVGLDGAGGNDCIARQLA